MLERPSRFGDKEVFSEQEAIDYERDLVGRWKDRFGDLELTTTGELSPEWQEHGTVVPGRRTSLIVDPSNGKVPLKPEVRARAQARAAELEAQPADDPEARTLYERCLIGSAGPPMMPPVYNQNLQIVQTREHVLIVTEMIHDARVVRMNAAHLPPAIRLWMGDSVGRWDGDTLVVDTTNFTGKTRWRQSGKGCTSSSASRRSPARRSATTSRWRIAATYTQAWSGRLWITRTDEPDVRIRVPRGELRDGGNPARRADETEPRRTLRRGTDESLRLHAALRSYPENPIHRPPAPTPNHSASETSATSFITIGDTRPSPASVTFRRTVSAKMVPSSRQIIFTANGVL